MTRKEAVITGMAKSKETKYREVNKKVVIYSITNIKNGKKYIGSTVCFYKRRSGHIRDLERKKHHSILLQRSYDKHGAEFFEFDILEVFENESDRVFYEQKWINLTMSANPKYGYNVVPEATATGGGTKRTIEQRKAQSIRMKVFCSQPGQKEKRSEYVKKWAQTEESRKKFSEIYHSRVRPRQNNDKLFAEDVVDILKMYQDGIKQPIIATKYNICQSMVSRIVNKNRHKNK